MVLVVKLIQRDGVAVGLDGPDVVPVFGQHEGQFPCDLGIFGADFVRLFQQALGLVGIALFVRGVRFVDQLFG